MPKDKPEHDKPKPAHQPVSDSQVPASDTGSPKGSKEHIRGDQTSGQTNRQNNPRIVSIDKIPKIDVIEGIEANEIARTANNISRSAVIVNSLILLVTAGIASVAIWQYKSADSAAKTALKTYIADSINNERVFNRQKIADRKSDSADFEKFKRDTAIFNLQKKATNKQIDAFKETQKEFETSHSPYIRIGAYKMMPQKTLAVTVENQGAAIAWLLENEVKIKADIVYKPAKSPNEWRKRLPIPRTPWTFQTLIAPGHNIEFRVPLDSISDADMLEVKNGKKYLYIRTVIYYFNTTNGKYMSMEDISIFDAKLSGTGTIWFRYNKLKKYP